MTKLKLTYILHALLIFALVALGLYSLRLKSKVDELSTQEPQTITDTIVLTNIKLDTVIKNNYTYHLDTLELVKDTLIRDTVNNTVYVPVQVPLSLHTFDTLVTLPFCTTSSNCSLGVNVHGAVTGYGVTLDTLVLDTRLDATPTPVKHKFRILPAVGVGYGTGGLGVFAGLGFSYF